ncbi:hypothetical protein [Metallosphaera javensis (ex Sakai et al. 2022)]|uniref:hypothetical protein n=1 Tax=Metallosphaera javensis (ex Sakai et al. 2022) TaxID=2775498 RepID=UPI002583C04E|nr:MAG: hypothetical protein MjAS7_1625 [Metallosphaera javensis (ex Sakai et al. 2022)]
MMRNEDITIIDFEIEEIKPAKIVVNIKDEEVIIKLYLMPIAVIANKDKTSFSPISQGFIVVNSNEPRWGETCSQENIVSHKSVKVENVSFEKRGVTKLLVENKIIEISPKVTNLNIYPDLRDDLGNPCVRISWIQLTTVK